MQRVSFFLFLTFAITACNAALSTPAPQAELPASTAAPAVSKKADLPDLGVAPELTNTTWLNVAAPLRLANLRGKVVLIDMWTFG